MNLCVQYRPLTYFCECMNTPDLKGKNEYKSVKKQSKALKIICRKRKRHPQKINKKTVDFPAFEYLYFSVCISHAISQNQSQ